MEIFNIHIFEFVLIAGIALIVFGPERLPEVGRFIGKQVARFLAWQQQSPELKMLNDIRGEFESEIASLRDELTRARKELDVQQEMAALREELKPMLDLRNDINPPAGVAAADAATTTTAATVEAATPLPQPAEVAETLQQLAPEIKPAGQAVPSAVRPNRIAAVEPTNVFQQRLPEAEASGQAADAASAPGAPADGASAPDAPADGASAPDAPAAPADGALAQQADHPRSPEALASGEALLQRLDTLSDELHALVALLRARGVLDDEWRPTVAVQDEESVA